MIVGLSLIGCMTVGFIIGYFVAKPTGVDEPIGDLRVDQSDPYDGPYLFLELRTTPDFKKLDKVTLNVKLENYISQK